MTKEKILCPACGREIQKRKKDPLPDIPDRVKYECKCGHLYFRSEPRENETVNAESERRDNYEST